MTAPEFYRGATTLPVLGILLGILVGPVSTQVPFLGTIAQLPFALLIVGLTAALPYGIYLLVVWRFFRPTGELAHRRAALSAPIVIAIGVALGAAIVGGAGTPPRFANRVQTFEVAGIVVLGVGYFYVAVIELALFVLKRIGLVRPAS